MGSGCWPLFGRLAAMLLAARTQAKWILIAWAIAWAITRPLSNLAVPPLLPHLHHQRGCCSRTRAGCPLAALGVSPSPPPSLFCTRRTVPHLPAAAPAQPSACQGVSLGARPGPARPARQRLSGRLCRHSLPWCLFPPLRLRASRHGHLVMRLRPEQLGARAGVCWSTRDSFVCVCGRHSPPPPPSFQPNLYSKFPIHTAHIGCSHATAEASTRGNPAASASNTFIIVSHIIFCNSISSPHDNLLQGPAYFSAVSSCTMPCAPCRLPPYMNCTPQPSLRTLAPTFHGGSLQLQLLFQPALLSAPVYLQKSVLGDQSSKCRQCSAWRSVNKYIRHSCADGTTRGQQ